MVTRKNTYILPTRYGLLFVLVLAAMLAGSVNYNNNLGFLLVFLLGGMALISMLHTHRNIVGLRILSISAGPVFAGNTAVFDLNVYSESISRRALFLSLGKDFKAVESTEAGSQSKIRVKAHAADRGILTAGPLKLSTRYPLGLFFAWSVLAPKISCLVYPRPLYGAFNTAESAASEGALKQAGKSSHGNDDFMGLKAYQPGDPFRHISWKTYSRGQGLYTKEFAGHGGKTVMFDFDAVKDRDTETKLSRLCGLILTAEAANIKYGLKLPEIYIAPARGGQHKHKCLKYLALCSK